jgi:microcystin degradation protein MlrC
MPDQPIVATAGFLHESNSFSSVPTRFEDFALRPGGEGAIAAWARNQDEVAGFIAGARDEGLTPIPILVALATPSGPVTGDAFERITGDLLDRLKAAAPVDGLLLALHGAMVTQSCPHADAEVVRRLREALGPGFPIVVTHDFHANIPPEIIESSTALLTYKTNPHVDQHDCGRHAARLMAGILYGRTHPVQALAKPGMLYNIRFQNTSLEPLGPVTEASRALEREPGVLAASVAGGYQYADVPAMGPSVVVVTDGDRELAERSAARLGAMLLETAAAMKLELPDPAEAVAQALASDRFPVVLVEMGDNIGGGSPGDATFLLAELVRQHARGWVVAIADPEAVEAAVLAGVGQPLEVLAGGKTDRLHGDPVRLRGAVKSLHDGKFLEPAIRHGGQRYHDQGLSAVLRVEGSTADLENLLLVTSKRQMPFSLHQLISCGIYPERQRILVVKAAVAFRAAYEPVAARIIEVDTPGITAVNPARFTYRHVRRPLLGLD